MHEPTNAFGGISDAWYRYNQSVIDISSALGSTSNIVGELAELLVAKYTSGKTLGFSNKSVDIKTPEGKHIQVKARRMEKLKATQLGAIRSWDFDLLAVILFSLEGRVLKAILIDADSAKECSSFRGHINAWIVIANDKLFNHKETTDITCEITELLDSL